MVCCLLCKIPKWWVWKSTHGGILYLSVTARYMSHSGSDRRMLTRYLRVRPIVYNANNCMRMHISVFSFLVREALNFRITFFKMKITKIIFFGCVVQVADVPRAVCCVADARHLYTVYTQRFVMLIYMYIYYGCTWACFCCVCVSSLYIYIDAHSCTIVPVYSCDTDLHDYHFQNNLLNICRHSTEHIGL